MSNWKVEVTKYNPETYIGSFNADWFGDNPPGTVCMTGAEFALTLDGANVVVLTIEEIPIPDDPLRLCWGIPNTAKYRRMPKARVEIAPMWGAEYPRSKASLTKEQEDDIERVCKKVADAGLLETQKEPIAKVAERFGVPETVFRYLDEHGAKRESCDFCQKPSEGGYLIGDMTFKGCGEHMMETVAFMQAAIASNIRSANCPECNGTREYRGLNSVEPCKACCGGGE